MKSENLLITVAVIAVIISIVGVGITYDSISKFKNSITGFATDEGTVNVTIESLAAINFTTETMDFGNGHVDSGAAQATINSENNVIDGTWTPINTPLVIENIGNVNVTINISFAKAAEAFIGTGASLDFKISNSETDSCTISNTVDSYTTAPTSQLEICSSFDSHNSSDEMEMDIQIVIPSASLTGEQDNTITLTYEAV